MSTKPKTETESQIGKPPVEQMRAEAAAESRRIAGIRKLCGDNHPTIEADAIEQGWSITKTELAVLRSERPKAPDQTHHSPRYNREILEAAACLSVGIEEKTLLASYGEDAQRRRSASSHRFARTRRRVCSQRRHRRSASLRRWHGNDPRRFSVP